MARCSHKQLSKHTLYKTRTRHPTDLQHLVQAKLEIIHKSETPLVSPTLIAQIIQATVQATVCKKLNEQIPTVAQPDVLDWVGKKSSRRCQTVARILCFEIMSLIHYSNREREQLFLESWVDMCPPRPTLGYATGYQVGVATSSYSKLPFPLIVLLDAPLGTSSNTQWI